MKHGEEFNPRIKFYGLFVPNCIAMNDKILDAPKLLLGRLMQFAGKDGKAYPTVGRLAMELGWSKKKSQRNIKVLKDMGLINVSKLEPDNPISPNIYAFPYSPLYDFEPGDNVDTGCDGEDDGTSIPGDTDVTGPVSRMSPHIIESEIIESPICNSSKEEYAPAEPTSASDSPLDYNGLLCSMCNEPQFSCKSGDTCKNGHGGVEGIEKEEIAPISIFPTKLKRIIKTPNPFKYSPKTLKIIVHWEKRGGKVHYKTTSGNGLDKIKNMIDYELLTPGLNSCYSRHTKNDDLKKKQWTVNEILQSIDFYTQTLNKDVSKMYFSQFVWIEYFGPASRHLRNHSPLLDSFRNLPDEATEKWQALLRKKFNKLFPSVDINSTVLLNTAAYLVQQDIEFKVVDSGVLGNHMVNLYVAYMRRIVTAKGDYESLKYMSGQKNLDDFVTYFLTKSVKLRKRSKLA